MSKLNLIVCTSELNAFDAMVFFDNNTVNVEDGNGVTQTYYASEGKEGFTWRDYDGQFGVKKTLGTWDDFCAKLDATAS